MISVIIARAEQAEVEADLRRAALQHGYAAASRRPWRRRSGRRRSEPTAA